MHKERNLYSQKKFNVVKLSYRDLKMVYENKNYHERYRICDCAKSPKEKNAI